MLHRWTLRILPVMMAAVVLIISLAAPAGAVGELINFTDYVYDIAADGKSITLSFPSEYCTWLVYPANHSTVVARQSASVSFRNYSTTTAYLYPIGDQWERYLDISDIPSGSTGGISLKIESDVDVDFPSVSIGIEYYTGNNLEIISTDRYYFSNVVGESIYTDFTLNIPDGATACIFRCDIENITTAGNITLTLENFYLHLSVSALYLQQIQTGKTNKLLEDVSQKLEEQGKTLDEILSGGEAGEDLIAGNDKLEDAGEGLGDDIGQIQDFENQYFGQLEDSMGDLVDAGDLSFLVAPLSFCQGYLNKIVAGIPSKYMVIFTLPVLFGIFFYVVQHPIKAPRPDTSGDQVTRETFTTTTVLSGKHAGQSTTTRTVTTSQEIGRVHRE